MAKTIIALVIVLVVALGLQIVGVVSCPVTTALSIASYDDIKYGLFGTCDSNFENCSDIALGYSSDTTIPKSSLMVLTKLLIVHVVAAGCTLIMLVLVLAGICANRRYFLALSILAVPSFLVTLLAFLVEILLFTRHLSFAGWFVLGSVVLNALVIVLLCVRHRSLSDKYQGSTLDSGRDDEKLINTRMYQESVGETTAEPFDRFEPQVRPPVVRSAVPHGQAQGSQPSLASSQYTSSQSHGHGQAPQAPSRAPGAPAPSVPSHAGGQYGLPPRPQIQTRPEPVRKDTHLQPQPQPLPTEFDFESPRSSIAPQQGVPPAGTSVYGVDDSRTSFGPGVVAVPQLRRINPAAHMNEDEEQPREGRTPISTPRMVRGIPRDESQVGMVQYAQPQQGSPQRGYNPHVAMAVPGGAHGGAHGGASGPMNSSGSMGSPGPHTGYTAPHGSAPQGAAPRAPRGYDPAEQFLDGMPERVSVASTPQPNARLMERFMQELPPSRDYYEYQPMEEARVPASPVGSDPMSEMTSISQRGQPKRGVPQVAVNGPAARRAQDRNDLVLNANPDFAVPALGTKKRGKRARAGHGF